MLLAIRESKKYEEVAGESGSISCKSLLSEADGFIQGFPISHRDISLPIHVNLFLWKQKIGIRRAVWGEKLAPEKQDTDTGLVAFWFPPTM